MYINYKNYCIICKGRVRVKKRSQTKRLGEYLMQAGSITNEQLGQALEKQQMVGKKIGEILVDEGWVTEEEVVQALSFQKGLPYVDLEKFNIDMEVVMLVPEKIAKKDVVMAFMLEDGKVKVAMKDPQNLFALEDLKLAIGKAFIPVMASEKGIMTAIDKFYASAQTRHIMTEAEKQMKEEAAPSKEEETDEEKPFILLVNNILERSILSHASDIHIEPFEKDVRIRYRIDGQLYELTRSSLKMLDGITTRIKVLAGLNITERRLPQDGRMSKRLGNEQVDLRISILPTLYGEKTVIRLIYRNQALFSLEEIGFHPIDYDKMMDLLNNPHGLILLTGPTGSGKSTTLAAALKRLNQPNINIVTVEDPIENRIDGINQVATNASIGLTFANVLRSILRQDPDIIMVGEMRDTETCSIAVRAAITGHLVLSTLHTNDAASSITRLVDMGIAFYMVGAAIKGVISQRLVRRLCKNCRKKHTVTSKEQALYGISMGKEIYDANGCSACHGTGYKGRFAIHEVLVIDGELGEWIASGKVRAEEIRKKALTKGMRSLWDNGVWAVQSGETTLEEILKVVYEK